EGANDPANPYPPVRNLLTVGDDFESWPSLSKTFFDDDAGIVTEIIVASGKSR
ncbi:MAG: sulfate ABC transporter substrate-binding protein, partial [Acidimicrobiales bacterium]|nr:sulfate ABC transporter substrate-binding protein [Acidimicrobiales bacterium]